MACARDHRPRPAADASLPGRSPVHPVDMRCRRIYIRSNPAPASQRGHRHGADDSQRAPLVEPASYPTQAPGRHCSGRCRPCRRLKVGVRYGHGYAIGINRVAGHDASHQAGAAQNDDPQETPPCYHQRSMMIFLSVKKSTASWPCPWSTPKNDSLRPPKGKNAMGAARPTFTPTCPLSTLCAK